MPCVYGACAGRGWAEKFADSLVRALIRQINILRLLMTTLAKTSAFLEKGYLSVFFFRVLVYSISLSVQCAFMHTAAAAALRTYRFAFARSRTRVPHLHLYAHPLCPKDITFFHFKHFCEFNEIFNFYARQMGFQRVE